MSTTYFDDAAGMDLDSEGRTLAHYGEIARRRWMSIALSASGIFLCAVLLAFLLPPTYRSSATILIQEQEIPQELVRSTITSFADERIQVISQQVLARSVLLDLINKYDLYSNRRRFQTNEEVIDRMREDIKLQPVSAEVMDRKTGSQVKATIAFKLAFESGTAANAQKIANELASLYLNENIKNREERAAETSSFLEEEAQRLSKHIADVEAQLATFKEKNQGRLPELRELNLQLSDRNSNELLRVERDMTENMNRRSSLESELALTSPYSALPNDSGERAVLQPEDKLKALQAQLASLKGAYTDDYPDIQRIQREITSLEAQGYGIGPDAARDQRISNLRAKLVDLKQKYGESYPDVVRTQHELDALEKTPAVPATKIDATRIRADNPVYLNLRSEIDSANAQIQALKEERAELLRKQADLDTRLLETPQVEREYLELSRDQDNSRARYRELKQKQMDAEVAEQLEHDRKAERFTLIEPPQYPERPSSPNRIAIILAGFVLSLAGGASIGATREVLDDTIKAPGELARVMQVPTLGVIPSIEQESTRIRRRKIRWIVALCALGFLILIILLVNFLVMPLDVIWFSLMRRFFI